MVVEVKIKKGHHFCNLSARIKLWWGINILKKRVESFTMKDAKYFLEGDDQHDWNKLIGRGKILPRFTKYYHFPNKWQQWMLDKLGFTVVSGHHYDSERLVWRWYNNHFEYAMYTYSRFGRHSAQLNNYEIAKVFARSFYKANLFPYFGGNKKAPKDIHITIYLA